MNLKTKVQKRQRSSLLGSWLWLVFCFAFLLLQIPAVIAQPPPHLRAIVADCINKSSAGIEDIAPLVTVMLTQQWERTEKERVQIIERQELFHAARSAASQDRLPPPFSSAALLRLAPSVQADIIVESQVAVAPYVAGRPADVVLQIALRDVVSREYLRGGYGRGRDTDLTQAVKQAVNDVQRNMILIWRTADIQKRVGNLITLNGGLREGINPDDVAVIMRGSDRQRKRVGKVRVVRSFANDSEAEPLEETEAIQAGDKAIVLYTHWPDTHIGELPPNGRDAKMTTAIASITEITVEHSNYQVTLHRDGTALYFGEAKAKRKGLYSGHLWVQTFDRLAEAAELLGYFALRDSYTLLITDQAGVTTSVVKNGKRKEVYNYANAGPTALWSFETLLDTAVDSIDDWTKSKPPKP